MFNGYESSRKIKIVDLPQDTLTIINKMKVETKGPMKLKSLPGTTLAYYGNSEITGKSFYNIGPRRPSLWNTY